MQDIVLATARDPSSVTIFNHASMAFNNHFFFNGLVRRPRLQRHRPIPLQTRNRISHNPLTRTPGP